MSDRSLSADARRGLPVTGETPHGAPRLFVIWLDASDGSIPTHDGVQWPDGTVSIRNRRFRWGGEYYDADIAAKVLYGKLGRVAWADANETAAAPAPAAEPDACRVVADDAWGTVWLHSKWRYLTSQMTTPSREHAADAVARWTARHAIEDNEPDRGEPEGLRWWRETA